MPQTKRSIDHEDSDGAPSSRNHLFPAAQKQDDDSSSEPGDSSSSEDEADPISEIPGTSAVDVYDSSDEEDMRNTIGNIPFSWYDDLDHVGYDWEGKKIAKTQRRSEIDEFLAKMEDPDYWRRVIDSQTGQEVTLTDEHVNMISNILRGRYPDVGYNPYEPYVDFFTKDVMIHPLSNRPEHKRSFIPSLLEKKKVGKLVHAMKMGWLKPRKPKTDADEEPKYYDLWAKERTDPLSRSELARIKMQIPAPKMKLPGHAESYNPPAEYQFTEEEQAKWEELEPEDRQLDFLPQKHGSMREVPAYPRFINDRFERCLDLFMAPRRRRIRLNVEPKDLLPQLPKPQDLQPFPTTLSLTFTGHTSLVRAVTIEPFRGQYIASGGDDGVIRVWEVGTGRCLKQIPVDGTVNRLAWCPNPKLVLIAAAVGSKVYILNPRVGDKLRVGDTNTAVDDFKETGERLLNEMQGSVQWSLTSKKLQKSGVLLEIIHKKEVKQVTWHIRGDYFASVCPDSGNTAISVHQLSTFKSQTFARSRGLVQCVSFHPTRPLLFVATQILIRVYDLVKQQVVKKLQSNCRWISSIAVHPKGDNLIVGSYDCRLSWFDLDLSAKPYKTLRHHRGAIRSVAYHPHYPLFATASDDGSVIVCHGMVYSDLLQNPLIVPVKILRGHKPKENMCVLDCVFHPTQPWIITAGADGTLKLYTY